MKIAFTVHSIPVAQPRQRHAVREIQGRAMAVNYTPAKHPVNAFKSDVRMALASNYDGPPLTGPIRLDVVYVMPRPGNMMWRKRPMPRARHAKKPDRDNLEKALKDALTGLAWVDDAQVCAGEPQKWIAAGDEQPHVEVTIEQLTGDQP